MPSRLVLEDFQSVQGWSSSRDPGPYRGCLLPPSCLFSGLKCCRTQVQGVRTAGMPWTEHLGCDGAQAIVGRNVRHT